MDPQDKRPTSKTEPVGTFSEAEYSANPGRVIGHAAATGTAVVSAADGSPRVVITIPTVDLPTLGD